MRDLEEIAAYIARDNPQAARKWIANLRKTAERAAEMLGQLLSTTEDGEHENVIVTNAVYDSIASQEDLSDVVTLDLRNDTRRQGKTPWPRSRLFCGNSPRVRAIDLLHSDPDGRRLGSVIPRFDFIVERGAIVVDKPNVGAQGLDIGEVDFRCGERHQDREVDEVFGAGGVVEGDLGSVQP